jgi:hypothetical protein
MELYLASIPAEFNLQFKTVEEANTLLREVYREESE